MAKEETKMTREELIEELVNEIAEKTLYKIIYGEKAIREGIDRLWRTTWIPIGERLPQYLITEMLHPKKKPRGSIRRKRKRSEFE